MNHDLTEAWDCDPFFIPECLDYDLDVDCEDSESDWQILALDRFGDRTINGDY